MKKLAVLIGILIALSYGTGAWAALVTITFDEAYVTAGTLTNRQDGTQVSTQYTGFTWADIYPGADSTSPPISYTGQVVCMPGEHSGPGFNTGNYLWIYGSSLSGTGAQTATVTLSTPSNYFSIDYRRPQNFGDIDFDLYMGETRVYDGSLLSWAPGDGWRTFTAPSVTFDKVVIWESDKSDFDNLTINSVPIPGAILLFAPGLAALVAVRKKGKKQYR